MLDLDLKDVSFIRGVVTGLDDGEPEEWETVLKFVLPGSTQLPTGWRQVEYGAHEYLVQVRPIASVAEDELYQAAKEWMLAGPAGLRQIPAVEFLDNDGEYPAYMVEVLCPIRVVDGWSRWAGGKNPPTAEELEEINAIGHPPSNIKKVALVMLNRFLKARGSLLVIQSHRVTAMAAGYRRDSEHTWSHTVLCMLMTEGSYQKRVAEILLAAKGDELQTAVGPVPTSEEELAQAVMSSLERELYRAMEYRRFIEPFWNSRAKHEPRPKSETQIQPTLHFILALLLKGRGVHVSREEDLGAGLLDFSCSCSGPNGEVLTFPIEFKLAHNPRLRHGMLSQLPKYMDALDVSRGGFVVMWFKDAGQQVFKKPKRTAKSDLVETLKVMQTKLEERGLTVSTLLLDASVRPSASKG